MGCVATKFTDDAHTVISLATTLITLVSASKFYSVNGHKITAFVMNVRRKEMSLKSGVLDSSNKRISNTCSSRTDSNSRRNNRMGSNNPDQILLARSSRVNIDAMRSLQNQSGVLEWGMLLGTRTRSSQ